MSLEFAIRPVHVSKHRQFDPETGKHIPGKCRIATNSSLRKLMRAARRGVIPPERMRVIDTAQENASSRAWKYLNSCPVKRARLDGVV